MRKQTTDLEIFKYATDLLSVVFDLLPRFPRGLKDVRVELLRETVAILTSVAIANEERGPEKIPFIKKLLRHLYAVQYLLRMSVDKRFITPEQFAPTFKLTTSINRQAHGWKKFSAS